MTGTPKNRKLIRPYVKVDSETIRNPRLGWKGLGMLVFIMNLPDDWDINARTLSKTKIGEGVDSCLTGLKNLKEEGHYRLERRQLLSGKFEMGTAISEFPVASWAEEYAEYAKSHKGAVPMIQQKDGTFKVRRKDGRLTSDGFDSLPPLPPPPDGPTDEWDPEPPVDQEETAGQTATGKSRSGEGSPPPQRGKPVPVFPEPVNPVPYVVQTRTTEEVLNTSPPAAGDDLQVVGGFKAEDQNPSSAVGGNLQVVSPVDNFATINGSTSAETPADAGRNDREGGSELYSDDRAKPDQVRVPPGLVRAASAVYRSLPPEVRGLISARRSKVVLAAIVPEFQHREPGQLIARVNRNWLNGFAGRDIHDPVGVAIRLVRRGLHCPDVRCEDGIILETGAECAACKEILVDRRMDRLEAAAAERSLAEDAEAVALEAQLAGRPRAGSPSAPEERTEDKPLIPAPRSPEQGVPTAAEARALLGDDRVDEVDPADYTATDAKSIADLRAEMGWERKPFRAVGQKETVR